MIPQASKLVILEYITKTYLCQPKLIESPEFPDMEASSRYLKQFLLHMMRVDQARPHAATYVES